MDLTLVLVLLVFFLDFPLQDLEEFGFEEDLFDGDEDFEDHLKDLALCEFEPVTIGNDDFVVDQLVPVQVDQIFQLIVDDLELLPDELLKQEDISILVDVVKPVDVGTQCTPDLPTIRTLQAIQAVGVRMDILKLADIDEVLALDHHGEQFEEGGDIALLRIEGEVVPATGEVNFALEDKALKAIILEAVHEYLLIDPESFIIEK